MVSLGNISLMPLTALDQKQLTPNLSIVPMLVPHRDEFSETVGYKIIGPKKTALFIPDIDKWQKWQTSIKDIISEVDYALIDATFFANNELPNRDMSEVPHPFVVKSMSLLASLSSKDKAKVIFIHFNHSNPLLIPNSNAQQQVKKAGFNIAYEDMTISL